MPLLRKNMDFSRHHDKHKVSKSRNRYNNSRWYNTNWTLCFHTIRHSSDKQYVSSLTLNKKRKIQMWKLLRKLNITWVKLNFKHPTFIEKKEKNLPWLIGEFYVLNIACRYTENNQMRPVKKVNNCLLP